MWIWLLLIVVCLLYGYYVSVVCGWVLPSSLASIFKRSESEEVGVAYDVKLIYRTVSYWIDTLNRIIKETQMKHYVFVQELPPINKAEKETLYCILYNKYAIPFSTFKEPFFRTYILTDDGAYKFIDITKI